MKNPVELNRLLLKFLLLCYEDFQESSRKNNAKFKLLGIIWENKRSWRFYFVGFQIQYAGFIRNLPFLSYLEVEARATENNFTFEAHVSGVHSPYVAARHNLKCRSWIYDHFHNILRLFDVFAKFSFYYKWNDARLLLINMVYHKLPLTCPLYISSPPRHTLPKYITQLTSQI